MVFVLSQNLSAQNQERPQNYGQWLMYFGDNKLNNKLGIHSELQLRNFLVENTVEQTLVRVGLNYYVDNKVMLTSGYGFIYTGPSKGSSGGFITSEHRIWQQLVLRQPFNRISVEHRYRLEQRFIENFTLGKHNFENRIRYRLQLVVPLKLLSSSLSKLNLVSYNELFLNLGRKVSGEIFDRNRLFGALAFKLSTNLSFQLGYLNQIISNPDKTEPDINHNLQIAIVFNPVIARKNAKSTKHTSQ